MRSARYKRMELHLDLLVSLSKKKEKKENGMMSKGRRPQGNNLIGPGSVPGWGSLKSLLCNL